MNAAPPTKRAMLAFELKAAFFRAKRFATDARGATRRWPLTGGSSDGALLAEISTPLRSAVAETDPREARLIEGKIHNLHMALRRLDGAVVPSGSTFSFWRQIGRATRRAGYVEGRELREGCIIPTVGGGLCQLSNALYAAALDSGCEIVERHAHSHFVPGSMTERDRDATVFWNYVDLRFRARHELTIRCRLQDDRLIVQFFAPVTAASIPAVAIRSRRRHRSRAAVVPQLRSSRVHTTSQNTRRELCTGGSILTRRLLARIRCVRRKASNDKRRGVRSDRRKTF